MMSFICSFKNKNDCSCVRDYSTSSLHMYSRSVSQKVTEGRLNISLPDLNQNLATTLEVYLLQPRLEQDLRKSR
jgi:hypothetical protein